MREITGHHINACNRAITIEAGAPEAPGGAPTTYFLTVNGEECTELTFQRGPVPEGINGLTNEALLVVLIDRLEGFQSGPFACGENGTALQLLRSALGALHHRTKGREARGVEGTHEP